MTIDPADIDETLPEGAAPAAAVRALAATKARVVAARWPAALVVGADTIVALDGVLLGKPADDAEALRMLRRLRGRSHHVITGIAIVHGETIATAAVAATVAFRDASDAELAAYVATGEPRDKAGAYGIQERGGALVATVAGCYLTVVGLPICRLARLMATAGLAPPVDAPAVCLARTGRPCAPDCCGI